MNSVSNKSFYSTELLPRWNNFSSIPRDVVEGAYNLVVGAFFQATSLLTLGQVKALKDSNDRLFIGAMTASAVFEHAMKTINPRAKGLDRGDWGNPVLNYVESPLQTARLNQQRGGSVLGKRVIAVVQIPVGVLRRVVDLAVGALALIPSVILLGTNERLNAAVAAGLRSPTVFPSVCNHVRCVFAGEC